ncbi:MAG: dipeptide ABC transporter ATP-binding protein [Paracoccaceae bacterium]
MPLLTVDDLTIRFAGAPSARPVVSGVSFALEPGQTLAVVGESGSGKTLTGKALMGLLPRNAQLASGQALFQQGDRTIDLFRQSRRRMRRLRGETLSMIFQEPMSALSPLHTVGAQVQEVLSCHGKGGRTARARVIETFEEVGFPDPERAYAAYPFELSGGLRQRAVIAMAMVGSPALVIADEPTTALDVTTQATVLDLLRRLQKSRNLSVILITHDLGVVSTMADAIVVMQRGEVMERGAASIVLEAPGHAYTRTLMDAAPRIPETMVCHSAPANDPILTVEKLNKTYRSRLRGAGAEDRDIRAVVDFSATLERGRTVAVVGESGSGKSTVARLVLRAERPDPGSTIQFRGSDGLTEDVATLSGRRLTAFRRRAQMVFQDPFAALSPRMSVQDILTEPLRIHGIGTSVERRDRAAHLLTRVGLRTEHLSRFPFAFSGGQRQRIAIARALALSPELLILDEPTSALDVSVQAEVLALLDELKAENGLSYLFISHDLAVVARLADRVLVMRRGHVVEEGACDSIFRDPRHPYTRALIAASPEPGTGRKLDLAAVSAGAGEPESWPEPFRYPGHGAPDLTEVAPGHLVRAAA